jgi:hypothetical protein
MIVPVRYYLADRYVLTPRDEPEKVVGGSVTIDAAIAEARRCSLRLRAPVEVRDYSDRDRPLLRGVAESGRWMWRTPCGRCEGTGRAATDWSRKRIPCRSCAGTGFIFA